MNISELRELAEYAKVSPVPKQKNTLLQSLVQAGAMTAEEAEYQTMTVKQLRERASANGISPIPSAKKELISSLVKSSASQKIGKQNLTKQIKKAGKAVVDSSKAPVVSRTKKSRATRKGTGTKVIQKVFCGGKGVTEDSLREELRNLGYLDEYRAGGYRLGFPELRAICKKHNTGMVEPPKRAIPPIDESASGEYAMKIKKQDPALYDAVHAIVSYVPDPRILLEKRIISSVIWDPWKALYTELEDLFEQGQRFMGVLNYVQTDTAKKPEDLTDELISEFTELFPVLSYIYAWDSVYFRWLLVEHHATSLFKLSRFVDVPEAKIPSLLRPCRQSYSRSKFRRYGIPLEHTNCSDLSMVLTYLRDISLFKETIPEDLLSTMKASTGNGNTLFTLYYQGFGLAGRFTDPGGDWYEILVYLLQATPEQDKRYANHFETLAIVSSRLRVGWGSAAYRIARKLFEALPQDQKSIVALLYFEGYEGNEDRVKSYVLGSIKKESERYLWITHVLRIADVALYRGYGELWDYILGQIPKNELYDVIYENLLEPPYYELLTTDQTDPFKLLLVASGSEYPPRGLEMVFEEHIDPNNPPDYIKDAFKTWGSVINNKKMRPNRWSGPPSGWSDASREFLVKLFIRYGATIEDEDLSYIQETLAEPGMKSLVEWIEKRKAHR